MRAAPYASWQSWCQVSVEWLLAKLEALVLLRSHEVCLLGVHDPTKITHAQPLGLGCD